jgi:hypothetical protein
MQDTCEVVRAEGGPCVVPWPADQQVDEWAWCVMRVGVAYELGKVLEILAEACVQISGAAGMLRCIGGLANLVE